VFVELSCVVCLCLSVCPAACDISVMGSAGLTVLYN